MRKAGTGVLDTGSGNDDTNHLPDNSNDMKLPKWVLRGYRQLLYISEWLDNKVFTVPDGFDERVLQQAKVEEEANYIRRALNSCNKVKGVKKMRALNGVQRMILNFQLKHGNTPQVQCWVDSLRAELQVKYCGELKQL